MALRINTNVTAMTAMRHMHASSRSLEDTSRRLSSGMRITAASDDAMGLGISERMRADMRGVATAARTAQDGISFLQVADSKLDSIQGLTTRIREIAVQGLNGTLSTEDIATLDEEMAALAQEASRLLDDAEFNGTQLFPLSDAEHTLKSGTEEGDEISVDFSQVNRVGPSLEAQSVSNTTKANRTLAVVDSILEFVGEARGEIGSGQNRLDSAIRTLDVRRTNLVASESRIRDADIAQETAQLVKSRILQQGGAAVLAQANAGPNLALSLLGA
ncbi:MAG: flagellin [Planctomycetota bacterium]|jgi:flagellin